MGKIHLCDTCQFYSNDPHLVCAVHPYGVHSNECLDYRRREDLIGENEEQWCPTGYYWYDGELIPIEPQRLTNEERLELLDSHPLFTGVCPECGYQFPRDNPPKVGSPRLDILIYTLTTAQFVVNSGSVTKQKFNFSKI